MKPVSGCSVDRVGKLENPVPKLVLFPNNSSLVKLIGLTFGCLYYSILLLHKS
jgi:hypothetical protein